MATIAVAMWLQEADLTGTNHLIMIFIGLVALAMLIMAVATVVAVVTAAKAVKGMTATADELKGKMLPLIDVVMDLSKTGQDLLHETAPKMKHITDTMVEASNTLSDTSKTARSAVQKFDATITDINDRTQRQVARVDGMVTSALTTTVEVVETIGTGIKVPAQKIAAAANQLRYFAEGLVAKLRNGAGADEDE